MVVFAACQKEEDKPVASDIRNFDVNAEVETIQDETKTYLNADNTVLWGAEEYMLLYYNDGSDKFSKSLDATASVGDGKAKTTFGFNISPAAASQYTFGGVYPASAVKQNTDGKAVKVALPSVQYSPFDSYDAAAYILVAMPSTSTTVPSSWTAYFRRATALNKIVVKGLTGEITEVEISSAGKSLAGERNINLTTGESASIVSPSSTIKVNYSQGIRANDATIFFTTWESSIAVGESLVIKITTSEGEFTKTITPTSKAISFKEGKLNIVTVDFSTVKPVSKNLKGFATEFVKVLDEWQKCTTEETTVGVTTFDGHYVPADYDFEFDGVTYTKTAAFDVAIQGIAALMNGGNMNVAVPAVRGYKWSENPYNESSSNGGPLGSLSVDSDFILNYIDRTTTWAKSNNVWSNFCIYTDESGTVYDKGTPSVAGKYTGTCCLERAFLIVARFYKYLLDKNIDSNVKNAVAGVTFDADLYGVVRIAVSATSASVGADASTAAVTVSSSAAWTASSSATWLTLSASKGNAGDTKVTLSAAKNTGAARSAKVTFTCDTKTAVVTVNQSASSGATIAEFAKAFAGILDVWTKNTTTTVKVGDVTLNGHYIPAATTVTVGGKAYGKAQLYDIALQSLYLLNNGSATSASMPLPNTAYKWGANSYLESTAFTTASVDFNFMLNFASRELAFVKDASSGNGTWSNFCTYGNGEATTKGTPQVSGYKGNCCLDRSLLIMARFYKYLIDKNITTNVKTAIGTTKFSADLYGLQTLSVSATTATIANTASANKSVTVTASAAWTASSSASWLTLSATKGSAGSTSLKMTATANTGAARTAKVTIKCDTRTATVTVTQNAVSVKVSASSLSLAKSASSGSVTVTASTSWTLSESISWITPSVTKGNAGSTTVKFTATANSSSSRSGTVTIKCGTASATVKITQAAGATTYSNPYTQKGIHTNQGAGYLGQKTGYTCGPHSIMQCIYKMTGKDLSEMTIASWAGTTSD
ncbi:MAG: BACON domain-containing protein, partial [Bacteroidales bacterium]|nr:BACON domain-containing protein [Bacteroidales bacterium]